MIDNAMFMAFDPAERYRLLTRLFLSTFELPRERREGVLRSAVLTPDLMAELEDLLALHDALLLRGADTDPGTP